MRTTVTLDPDVVAQIKTYMRESGASFKEALNFAIRSGLSKTNKHPKAFRQKTYDLGLPTISVRKALKLAADLEDEEILRDLSIHK